MQDNEFSKVASSILALIADIVETEDKEGLIDVDFLGDILNLTTERGVFVINKHSAAKEIWLASPLSGPYHFCYNGTEWRSKSGRELFDILEQELKINFSKAIG